MQTESGPAVGTVVRDDPAARRASAGPAPTRRSRVVRLATRDDIVARLKHQQREQEAYRDRAAEDPRARPGMKLARVEQAFDGSRLIFYFTADGRVDFRELVRELAAEFRTRIEMRQIGVRDEAKMLGGYGTCGRPLCCTTFLHDVRAGVDQDGQAAGPEPEPVEAVGPVRPAEVLPALRAAERQRRRSHGGCGSEGGCDNPSRLRIGGGCGSGGCGSCGCGSADESKSNADETSEPLMKPRIAITVGDPAGIGPEIAARAAADPRVLDVCEPVALRPAARGAAFAPGVLSAAAGRAAYDVDRARGRRCAARRRRGDRHGAGQQGSVPAGRAAVERPHRSAGAPDRRAARGDDVLLRGAARRAGDGAHRRSPRCRAR